MTPTLEEMRRDLRTEGYRDDIVAGMNPDEVYVTWQAYFGPTGKPPANARQQLSQIKPMLGPQVAAKSTVKIAKGATAVNPPIAKAAHHHAAVPMAKSAAPSRKIARQARQTEKLLDQIVARGEEENPLPQTEKPDQAKPITAARIAKARRFRDFAMPIARSIPASAGSFAQQTAESWGLPQPLSRALGNVAQRNVHGFIFGGSRRGRSTGFGGIENVLGSQSGGGGGTGLQEEMTRLREAIEEMTEELKKRDTQAVGLNQKTGEFRPSLGQQQAPAAPSGVSSSTQNSSSGDMMKALGDVVARMAMQAAAG